MIDRGELLRKLALNVARFSGIGALAARYTAGAGAILMLHRVTREAPGPLGFNRHLLIDPEFLHRVLKEMRRLGFVFVTMDEVVDRLRSGATAERFVTITADDGYRDNLVEALPILEEHKAPITIYVAPALIEGGTDLWWDVLEEVIARRDHIWLPTDKGVLSIDCRTSHDKFNANTMIHNYLTTALPETEQRTVLRELAASAGVDAGRPSRESLMNWDEIRTASRHPLVTIGAHTMNHYNLKRLSVGNARDEMDKGARVLEMETGARPRHFAYPYGYAEAVGAREVGIARELGFASAVTTRHGVLHADHRHHLHALPRISVNGRYQNVGHVRTMVKGVTTPLANGGRQVVTV